VKKTKAAPRKKKAAPPVGKNAPAGKNPAGLRVRMYRVGFGDFFLVTVPTGAGPKHILIDCGVHSKDTHSIGAAVDHMAKETGKHLALIIVTHRHADHVTGFSKCKEVFKTFTVDRIWMSWYENPKDEQALAIQSNIAAMANNMINNQSLVTLFTFKGKTLLFAGDAQWGNWANILYGGKIGTELAASSKAILGKLDFYKVGHRGSTNATPKDALDAMKDGCVAMCSTEPKAYNLVPKPTLIAKIKAKTKNNFARSDQVPAGDHKTVTADAGKTLAKVFQAGTAGDCGYIDCTV
jgi:beta-lactamase superfamily II metal-dependent hydrolase